MSGKLVAVGLIVALAVLSLAIAAPTQSAQSSSLPRPEQSITKVHARSNGLVRGQSSPAFVANSWYFAHSYYCDYALTSTDSDFVLTVYFLEGGYMYTTNRDYAVLLAPACEKQNYIGAWIIDSSGDYNEIAVFPWS